MKTLIKTIIFLSVSVLAGIFFLSAFNLIKCLTVGGVSDTVFMFSFATVILAVTVVIKSNLFTVKNKDE